MQKKISNKEIIKRLLATAIPYKSSILVAVVMMIFFALINAAPAIYIKNIIDSIEGGRNIPNYKFFLHYRFDLLKRSLVFVKRNRLNFKKNSKENDCFFKKEKNLRESLVDI